MQAALTPYIYRGLPGLGRGLQIGYKIQKLIDVKKAHIAVSLILLVAETGIEPVTRGFKSGGRGIKSAMQILTA